MNNYFNALTLRTLTSLPIQSLPNCLQPSALRHRQRLAKPLASRHLRWQRMMRSSNSYSTVPSKKSNYFVRLVLKLSQQLSARERHASMRLVSEESYPYLCRITGRRLGVGQRARVRQSTCKTSSEVHSYAKRLWLPKGKVWSSETSHKLNREYSRGFRITQRCLTSFGQVVTLMPRSVRRCLTFPDLLRNRTLTYGSLQKARSWVVATGWAGLRLRRSYLRASLVLSRSCTTRRLQRS